MRFVDTSFWVALQLSRDANHAQARDLWRDAEASLITSNHVVGETWTFLRRRAGQPAAVAFVDAVRRSARTRLRFVGEAEERSAWAWLREHEDREYSFVDATSFALMTKLGLREALAFDGDFAAAGFVEVRT